MSDLDDSQLSAIRNAVSALVSNDHDAIASMLKDPDADIFLWTRDYGDYGVVHLVEPPGSPSDWAIESWEVTGQPTVGVELEMWTKEEGRSDLSLELELLPRGDGWTALLTGLHVL